MTVLFLLLYLLAGVFFGLAAARVNARVHLLSLGLFCWVLVDVIRTATNL